jgi:hypothetical protein
MPPRKRYQRRHNAAKLSEADTRSKTHKSAQVDTPVHVPNTPDHTDTGQGASVAHGKTTSYWPTSNHAYVLIEPRTEDMFPLNLLSDDCNDTPESSSVPTAHQTSKPRWPTSNNAYVLITTNKEMTSREQERPLPHVPLDAPLNDDHGPLGVATSLNAAFQPQDTMLTGKGHRAKARQPLKPIEAHRFSPTRSMPPARSEMRKGITSLPPSSPPSPLSPSYSTYPNPLADLAAEKEGYGSDDSDPFGFGVAEKKLKLQRKAYSEKVPSTPPKRPGASSSVPSTPSPNKPRFVRGVPGSASDSHASQDEDDSIQEFGENSGSEKDAIMEEEEESETPPLKRPKRRAARKRSPKTAEKNLDPRAIVRNLEALLPKRHKHRQAGGAQASSSMKRGLGTIPEPNSDSDDSSIEKSGSLGHQTGRLKQTGTGAHSQNKRTIGSLVRHQIP